MCPANSTQYNLKNHSSNSSTLDKLQHSTSRKCPSSLEQAPNQAKACQYMNSRQHYKTHTASDSRLKNKTKNSNPKKTFAQKICIVLIYRHNAQKVFKKMTQTEWGVEGVYSFKKKSCSRHKDFLEQKCFSSLFLCFRPSHCTIMQIKSDE